MLKISSEEMKELIKNASPNNLESASLSILQDSDIVSKRQQVIESWSHETQEALEDFFKDSIDGRVYYSIPKSQGVGEARSDLEEDYGIVIEQEEEGTSFFISHKGQKFKAIRFLKQGSEALQDFTERMAKLSAEDFDFVRDRLTSTEYKSFSERRNLKDVSDKQLRSLLNLLLSNEIVYNAFIIERDNNRTNNTELFFLGAAIDIKDKFNRAVRTLQSFADGANKKDNLDNSYDTIVLSNNAKDIALMSTNRRWYSCMNLKDGVNRHYVPFDIQQGTIIAYAVKRGDAFVADPIGRTLLKPYLDKSSRVFFKGARTYGQVADDFLSQVNEIAFTDLNQSCRTFKGSLDENLYSDGAPKKLVHFEETTPTKEVLDLLEVKYEYNKNGKAIVLDDLDLSHYAHLKSLSFLKDIVKIKGNLNLNFCKSLTSLEGMPKVVRGGVSMDSCIGLTSLKGVSEKIDDWLNLFGCNGLSSLDGMPLDVGYMILYQCSFPKDKELVWETTMTEEGALSKIYCPDELKDRIKIKTISKAEAKRRQRPLCANNGSEAPESLDCK